MIQVIGLEKINDMLSDLKSTLSPQAMERHLNTIGNMTQNVIEESFDSERSPFGEVWKPRKPTKKRNDRKLLYKNSYLSTHWQTQATPDEVIISNNTKSPKGYPYPAVHQFGSKNVEARPFLPIDGNSNLEPKLKENIETYLQNTINSAIH